MIALLCLALIAAVNCSPLSEVEAEWQTYKAQYRSGNYYADATEEAFRRSVFEQQYNIIAKHNKEADAGLHTWRMGVNEFSDLTDEEFIARYTVPGLYDRLPKNLSLHELSGQPLADEVDWRTKNVVTHVKNQGQCGSCFAFSAVDTVETQHALKAGELVELSPQNIVDCISKSDVCQTGGDPVAVFKFINTEGGIEKEADYPYTGKHGTCRFTKSSSAATVTGAKQVAANEAALLDAINTVGTISVAVAAGNTVFRNYKSGILKSTSCPNTSASLDHAIVAVGYNADAIIIKNSWGTSWGESGYVRFARGVNQCGVNDYTSYPTGVA